MIEREDIDGVAVVRLAHGPVNALDLELVTNISATFSELDASDHRAIVFTGAGRAFSAGVDLWRAVDGGPAYVRQFVPALVEAFETVFNTGKPVVAAVNGHAIAGGCILVSGCDYRIMSAGRIGVTELLVGVPFPISALEILIHAVGPQQAREAVLSGGTYDPETAVGMGLVDEVVASDRLLERAVDVANRLARTIPADTYRLTKEQLRLAVNERLSRLRPEYDTQTMRLWEGRATDGTIRAYMERITGRTAKPA
jgi:enoyl-CoA hydratase